jgi:hypothetical protein
MTRAARAAAPALLVLVALLPRSAVAHDRTVSYSTWEIDGAHARVTARITQLDVSRLPWAASAGADLDRQLGDYLSQRLTLRADGRLCTLTSAPQRLPTDTDSAAFGWEVTCPSPRSLRLESAVLADLAPSHLHYARVRRTGQPSLDRVLSEAEPAWVIGDGSAHSTAGDSFADFLRLGLEHTTTGWDHLVFLVALLLLGGTLRDMLRIVAGFTIAYSLTLALAVVGLGRPDPAPIEALVGLSVALIAAENLWLNGGRRALVRWALVATLLAVAIGAARGRGAVPALTLIGLAIFAACYFGLLADAARPAALRAAAAFTFGLIHGFAFAGVLLAAAVPSEELARALVGFNTGVVLGQVLAVVAVWQLLRLVQRYRGGSAQRAVVDYASVAILMMGTFWFVSRSYG